MLFNLFASTQNIVTLEFALMHYWNLSSLFRGRKIKNELIRSEKLQLSLLPWNTL